MKLNTIVLPFAYCIPSMDGIEKVKQEISDGVRADGNAALIQQMLQFYLGQTGQPTGNALPMLNYGCWCQLLTERTPGKGEAVDEFDSLCRKYQRCSKCVGFDHADKVTGSGDICNWETSRYEISYNAELERLDCSVDASDGACGFDQCKDCFK